MFMDAYFPIPACDHIDLFDISADVTIRKAGALTCRRCGCEDLPRLERMESGPHAWKALCKHCGSFLQWISGKSPAERHAARLKARQFAPASAEQLMYLKALGDTGEAPKTMEEASKLIDRKKMEYQSAQIDRLYKQPKA